MKFDEYYWQYYRRIVAFARSYVNDEMVAQDIAADSMVKLWMHLKDNPDADIHHWLFVIVKNLGGGVESNRYDGCYSRRHFSAWHSDPHL